MTAQVGPPEVGGESGKQECANGGRGETDRRNQHRLQVGGQSVYDKERGRCTNCSRFSLRRLGPLSKD